MEYLVRLKYYPCLVAWFKSRGFMHVLHDLNIELQ